MKSRLQAFAVITIISCLYAAHFMVYDLPIFISALLPTSSANQPLATNIQNSTTSTHIHGQSYDANESVHGENQSQLDHQNQESETAHNHQNAWKSLWRDEISGVSIKSKDISMDERQRNWKQIVNEAQNADTKNQMKDLFSAFPIPKRQKTLSVYSDDALNDMISKMFQAQQEGRNFTVVASGGSLTAGAAKNQNSAPDGARYYAKFASYLNRLLASSQEFNTHSTATVHGIGQGHGARTGLHTAIFFDSFIPADTDLLLWEFSINDSGDWFENPELLRDTMNQNFLVWLQEVSRMKTPAKVILLYYWDSPYTHDNSTKEIPCQAFRAHSDIAMQFDFVIGHVNLASYIDEVGLPGCNVWETCPLMADKTHASKLGHIATAFLLLNLINSSKKFVESPGREPEFEQSIHYNWTCGIETQPKEVLHQTITNSSTGWRSSVGAWTLDLPSYEQSTTRRLVPGPGIGKIELVNRVDPFRDDRKRATPLYNCDTNEEKSFSVIAPLEPMKEVRVVLLVFKRHGTVLNVDDIDLFLNGANMTTDGALLPMRVSKDPAIYRKWPCHFIGGWSAFADTYWYVFKKQQPLVHSMRLCIPSSLRNPPMIQAVAFW